ncbi:MAG: penicillin-binding protein 2 [Candidatus Nealsonbacteria bacterium]|nr:penicillin-binding protein 2 [Candidatus Nealsonbacteria bacterium]
MKKKRKPPLFCPNWLLERIRRDSSFVRIKNNLTEKEIRDLKEKKIKGVYLGREVKRIYPHNSLASQVVGFVGGDGIGQYGLEGFYNQILEGEKGFRKKTRVFRESPFINPGKRGSDLFLTLDYNIQFKAERLLVQANNSLDFERGTILVICPRSGKIIALANFPNFNPNQYEQENDFKIFKNSAVQRIFEPGSVLKPITMAAALEEQKITPQTTYIDEGKVRIGGHIIRNYGRRVWGERTMTEVLDRSINTGAVFVQKELGNQKFLEYLEKFGFFKKTEIDLQGEVFSKNREFKRGYEINFATASFGQGIEMTPIQLARAFLVIANNGRLVRPYLVEKIKNADGEIIKTSPHEPQPVDENRVISAKTASQLTTMMVSSVEKGWARRAKIPGYYLAGKTGTAQVPWAALGVEKRGYSDKTVQSFVGFGPAFNPQFLILITLDNPKTRTAEYSAVPLFRELASHIIGYYQIPPDY